MTNISTLTPSQFIPAKPQFKTETRLAASNISPEAWQRFVADSPFGDVLQTLPWGEVKRPEWQPIPVELSAQGEMQAAALVLRRNLGRLPRTRFYIGRGPVLDWNHPDAREVASALIDKIKAIAPKHRAAFIKIDPAVPDSPQIRALLTGLGFRPSPDAANSFGGTQPRFVMKTDITRPLDEVMADFHTKWRYNIRYAAKKGIEVKTDCTREDLKVFHDLYKTTAQRDGFTGYPLAYFHKLWDSLVERDMAKLFITSFEGQPLSGAISFVLGRQCWYVFGASSNEHRNLMPNHLMQWTMMQWAKERGCDIYDFRGVHAVDNLGANPTMAAMMESPDGLVKFKAGFNAQLIEYCGEWDLPLDARWYWMWTTARPRLVAALKKMKR